MIGEAWHEWRPTTQAVAGLVVMAGSLIGMMHVKLLAVDIMLTFVMVCGLILFARGIGGMLKDQSS